jgi:hypothetical protein
METLWSTRYPAETGNGHRLRFTSSSGVGSGLLVATDILPRAAATTCNASLICCLDDPGIGSEQV